MDVITAAHLLEQVDAVQERSRAIVRSMWFPFALWGGLAVGGSVIALAVPGQEGWYWMAACVVGVTWTARYYRRRSLRLGAVINPRCSLAAGILFCVAVLVAALAFRDPAAPWIAVGLGYQLLARVARNWTVSAAGWLLVSAALATNAAVSGPTDGAIVDLVCATVLAGTGLILRAQEQVAHRGLRLDLDVTA